MNRTRPDNQDALICEDYLDTSIVLPYALFILKMSQGSICFLLPIPNYCFGTIVAESEQITTDRDVSIRRVDRRQRFEDGIRTPMFTYQR